MQGSLGPTSSGINVLLVRSSGDSDARYSVQRIDLGPTLNRRTQFLKTVLHTNVHNLI